MRQGTPAQLASMTFSDSQFSQFPAMMPRLVCDKNATYLAYPDFQSVIRGFVVPHAPETTRDSGDPGVPAISSSQDGSAQLFLAPSSIHFLISPICADESGGLPRGMVMDLCALPSTRISNVLDALEPGMITGPKFVPCISFS